MKMGSTVKKIKFEYVESAIKSWFKGLFKSSEESIRGPIEASQIQMQSMAKESPQNAQNS